MRTELSAFATIAALLLVGCGAAATTVAPTGWQAQRITYCGECDGYNKITIPVEATPPDPDIARIELVTLTCEAGTQPLGFERGAFTVTSTPRAPATEVPAFDGGELTLTTCHVGQVAGSFRLDRAGRPPIAGSFDVAPYVASE